MNPQGSVDPGSRERVLITGASGFIGRRMVEVCARERFGVVRVIRTPQTTQLESVQDEVVGDIERFTRWDEVLEGVDVVVHLAARVHLASNDRRRSSELFKVANVDAAERLAQASVRAGVRRFVLVSSAGIHGSAMTNAIDEQSPVLPHTDYGHSKWAAETRLRDIASKTGLDLVVLRPPMVYGAGNPGNMLRLLRLISRRIPLPFGAVRNARTFLYVGNLVAALVQVCSDPRAANGTFLLGDDHPLSTPDLIRLLARQVGRDVTLWNVPPRLLRLGLTLLGKGREAVSLLDSMTIDDRLIRARLNWTPPYSVEQGLAEVSSWFDRTQGRA